MPAYALPAGIASVLLTTAAGLLGLLAGRQRPDPDAQPWWRTLGGVLSVLAAAGILFTAYFGVIIVLLDMGDTQSCFG